MYNTKDTSMMIKRYLTLPLIATITLLGSCSEKTDDPNPTPKDEIQLSAQMGDVAVSAQSATKAAVVGTEALTLYFQQLSETTPGTWAGGYSTGITGDIAAGSGERAIAFTTPFKYPTTPLKTKLRGYYPVHSSANGGACTFHLDGTVDVLYAVPVEGDVIDKITTPLAFEHKLTQIQFWFYAESQGASDLWGAIQSIKVLNQPASISLSATTDAFTASDPKTSSYTTTATPAAAAPVGVDNIVKMGNEVMIWPLVPPTSTLDFVVTTANQGDVPVKITQSFLEGVAYKLQLKITATEIVISTVTIAGWTAGYTQADPPTEI